MKENTQLNAGKLIGAKGINTLMVDVTVEQKPDNVHFTVNNGPNLKERKIRRGYLNREEFNAFMMLTTVNMLINGERGLDCKRTTPIWESWIDKKVMTPEQRKNIKMASTYFGKFLNDVFNNNFDVTTKQKVLGQLVKYDFRLIDDYTVQQIYNLMNTATKEFHLDQDEFFDLIEAKMEVSCKGCTKDRGECQLRSFFESKFIPPINEGAECNCEYAY